MNDNRIIRPAVEWHLSEPCKDCGETALLTKQTKGRVTAKRGYIQYRAWAVCDSGHENHRHLGRWYDDTATVTRYTASDPRGFVTPRGAKALNRPTVGVTRTREYCAVDDCQGWDVRHVGLCPRHERALAAA